MTMTVKQLRELLSRNLKSLRADRGMTQDDLAEAAGISKVFLAEIETGKKYPRIGNFLSLADALGVPPYWLIYPISSHVLPGTTDYADDIAERLHRDVTELLSHYHPDQRPSGSSKDKSNHTPDGHGA